MLIRLQTLARRFAVLRKPLLTGCLVMPPVILWLLAGPGGGGDDRALIPAILFFAWLLLLYTALTLFARVPEPDVEAGWWQRQKTRLVRFLYGVLAVLVTVLAIATVVTTWQLASAWVYLYVL
ncbi:MAG: hypothetical protein WEB57_01345 [Pseudohongiellaceae bacterium]